MNAVEFCWELSQRDSVIRETASVHNKVTIFQTLYSKLAFTFLLNV